MKKFLVILMMILLVGCKADNIGKVKIMTVSDLHYLDSSLYDDGNLFKQVLENGDGRIVEYSDVLVDALVQRTIEERPDVLVLTGDVSFSGEYVSHESLAAKLKKIEDEGIDVVVISGNHDVMENAYKFHGDDYDLIETVNSPLFAQIYEDYGYNQCYAKDPNSNTFIYQINDGLRIICLDANYRIKCSVPDETISWLKDELEKASNNNVKMISFSHQNLVKQSDSFDYGYVINKADKINKLYEKYGVPVNFSGHMHIQHVTENEYISEVLTEAMSLYQTHYGIIEVDKEGINYYTKSLNVPAYAEEHGMKDPQLLDFDNYSYERFMSTNSRKAAGKFDDEELMRFLGTLNLVYFTGELDTFTIPGEYKNVDSYYLTRIMAEEGNNYNTFKVKWD